MRRGPCAELAESRSAYVDGALDDAGREKLLAHLVGCAECRQDVAELRNVRDLLGRARSQPAPAADDLSARLISIAGLAATEPLWTRPFLRSGQAGPPGLPSRRRARRVRTAAAAAAAAGTFAAAGVIGYVAAPSGQLAVVHDPAGRAQAAFSDSLGQFPLASDSLGAVMLVDAGRLTAYPATVRPAPSAAHRSLSAVEANHAMARAVDSQHTVSYSGRQSFFVNRDGQTMWAEIAVEARSGQGTEVEVLSHSGEQLVHGFSPAAVSSRFVDDDLLDLLGRNYTLTGVGGATVAGRSATEISAWSLGQRAARWWLDDATGIVLWQEVYDRSGAVALSVGFTSVNVTPAAEMMEHLPPRLLPATATTSLSVADVTWLESAGWTCGRNLSGLSLVRLHTDRASDPTAVQAVYSDGVATVGVLEQRGRLEGPPPGTQWDPTLRAYVRHGASQTATWQADGIVVTVVTDGPADVLSRAVTSLPPERSSFPTSMDRVREGWASILAGLKG
ncbi:MAG TPA: zf-HC2 domain-containing protein [Propionibacteriaceae bacterium]|nr:zf-HC2 domain-containing protein [Propionibacteriaceae bacterium]